MLLGHRAKAKILMYLLTGGPAASEREISRILDLSHVAVNKIMKDFSAAGLVSASMVGGSKIWRINEASFAYEKLRNLASLGNPYDDLRNGIREKLEVWKGEIEFAAIYGSVAERREEAGSDIDVLVVLKKDYDYTVEPEKNYREDGKNNVKETISNALHDLSSDMVARYGNLIQPLVLTSEEAEKSEGIVRKARNGIYVIP